MKFCKRFSLVCFLILQVSLLKLNPAGVSGKWRLSITTEAFWVELWSPIWSDSILCSLMGIDPCHPLPSCSLVFSAFPWLLKRLRAGRLGVLQRSVWNALAEINVESRTLPSCSLPAPECTQSRTPVSAKNTEAVSLQKLKQCWRSYTLFKEKPT